jgi:hypothetical protein
MTNGYEWYLYQNYLERSVDEQSISNIVSNDFTNSVFVLIEGFEERSIGIAETLASSGCQFKACIIGTYQNGNPANSRYHERAESAARALAKKNIFIAKINSEGDWLTEILKKIEHTSVVLDITGLSTRSLFGALDAVSVSSKTILITYSEANRYWPTASDWSAIKNSLVEFKTVADVVDDAPWLFGHAHSVELIANHEGYDSPAANTMLLAFLPFKRARLAAIVSNHDYEKSIFIAGKPRLQENGWRLEALLEINRGIIKSWRLEEMSTFGYRKALSQMFELTLSENSNLLLKHNVHLGLLGSKLQDVGCWIYSTLVPSVAVITSVPNEYFPDSFSEGIGKQWGFPLARPILVT